MLELPLLEYVGPCLKAGMCGVLRSMLVLPLLEYVGPCLNAGIRGSLP